MPKRSERRVLETFGAFQVVAHPVVWRKGDKKLPSPESVGQVRYHYPYVARLKSDSAPVETVEDAWQAFTYATTEALGEVNASFASDAPSPVDVIVEGTNRVTSLGLDPVRSEASFSKQFTDADSDEDRATLAQSQPDAFLTMVVNRQLRRLAPEIKDGTMSEDEARDYVRDRVPSVASRFGVDVSDDDLDSVLQGVGE